MLTIVFAISLFAIFIAFLLKSVFMKFGSSLDLQWCLINEIKGAYTKKCPLLYSISLIMLLIIALSAYSFRERTEITEVLPYLLLPALVLNFVSLYKKIGAFFDKMRWAFGIMRQSQMRREGVIQVHVVSPTVAMIVVDGYDQVTNRRLYRVDCQRVGLAMSEITGFLMKSVVIFYEDSTQLNEIPVVFIALA